MVEDFRLLDFFERGAELIAILDQLEPGFEQSLEKAQAGLLFNLGRLTGTFL